MPAEIPVPESRPKLVIGWVLAADMQDSRMLRAYAEARTRLKEILERQFPEFDWQMPAISRRTFIPRGSLEPLQLLEMGAEEKLLRRWDYALVVVPNELEPRRRIFTMGIPSSALEAAVMSSARLGDAEELAEKLAALALHLLGHLFALEHAEHGAMHPPDVERLSLEPFTSEQIGDARERLMDVTDARLEETGKRYNSLSFYIRAFFSDPWSIIDSIWGYKPWRIPLYLGRLTATVVASLLVLLLTAESWEAGTHMRTQWLVVGMTASVIASSLFIFFGQSLDQVGRGRGWREQLARSRIVVLGTLLVGMLSLWLALFGILLLVSNALPLQVVSGWAGFEVGELPRLRYAAFMAIIGVLAGALGGNLEDEDEIKAELFFDEET